MKKIDEFFSKKPCAKTLKNLAGLYSIDIPSDYEYYSELVKLILKEKVKITIQFSKSKNSMDVIKI